LAGFRQVFGSVLQLAPTVAILFDVFAFAKCCSAFYELLKYYLYGSFGFLGRILPSPIRNYLFICGESDDIERYGRFLTENNSPTVAKNHILGSIEEYQAILPSNIWYSGAADAFLFVKDIKRSFEVKERLFDILETHPRIIYYISISKEPYRLLFGEASDGNLQAYLD
ncbi:hypothetical protein N7527_011072, partial [Penicillium freii]